MITAKDCFLEALEAPVRKLRARVELYDGSTLLDIFNHTDRLKSLTIERVAEDSKFFGFGICQKVNVKVLDPQRELSITTANTLEIEFGTGCDFVYTFPSYRVSEVHRDENTNELSITAYDGLYEATAHTLDEVKIGSPYTVGDFALAIASFLGFTLNIEKATPAYFNTVIQANFEGTETLREALNAVAEQSRSIYYIDNEMRLTFRNLEINKDPVFTITKDRYYTLQSGDNRRLATICHTTELGNNISATTGETGTTQYIRDNPFISAMSEIKASARITRIKNEIGGMTINQFECEWRGNFLLEIGDKIGLITKDNQTVYSYLFDDVISYDGSFREHTRWNYIDNDAETESNPTSLGDVIKKTYARVDKANKQIELLASEVATNYENISALQLNTESITASVQEIIDETDSALAGVNENIATLNRKVEATMTADNVQLAIQSELENGVNKITTKTGFTFDDVGLTIDKSGTEMKTQITEDGMTVYRDENAMLVANNIGVEATNLFARTYLIIGSNSRLENYGTDRTGCFWIGG